MRVVSGQYRGKLLQSADADITRPTSDRAKESLFNILNHILSSQNKIWADITFVDVFAGSGAIGIEALSRGAKKALFFENNKSALSFLTKNTHNLNAQIMMQDAYSPLMAKNPVDIIFFDPPYGLNTWEKSLIAFDKAGWINQSTVIIIETDNKLEHIIPPCFLMTQERNYGRNKFLFLQRT